MADNPVWEVTAFEGAGPLRLGMTREEVVSVMGPPSMVVSPAPILSEAHESIQAQYDPDGRLLAVQGAPGEQFVYREVQLGARPVTDVRRDLESLRLECRWSDEDDELTVPALGLSLYAPEEGPDPRRVQAVVIARRDAEAVVEASLG